MAEDDKLSTGLVIGMGLGLAIGVVGGKSIDTKVEVPQEPIAIVQEHRNEDPLLDLVLKYKDGREIVLYAQRDPSGNIEYSLQE